MEGDGSLIIWGQREWPYKLWGQGYIGVSGIGSNLLDLGGEMAPQLLGLGESPKRRCSMCLANGHKRPLHKAGSHQGTPGSGGQEGFVVLQQ